MKVSFFRNIQNYDQLRHKADFFLGIVAECQIIDTVELSESTYDSFCHNFLRSYDFLLPYIQKAQIFNDVWFGVLVKCRDSGIVVIMNGYQYPRYVGLAP